MRARSGFLIAKICFTCYHVFSNLILRFTESEDVMSMAKGFFGVLFSKESGFIMRVHYLRCFGSFAPASLDASDAARIFAVKEVLRERAINLIKLVEEYKQYKDNFLHYTWHGDNCDGEELYLNALLEQVRSLKVELATMLGLARHFHPKHIPNYDSVFSTTPYELPRLRSAFELLDTAMPITVLNA